MTREDVVRGLEEVLRGLACDGGLRGDAIREALILLTPPKQEEIEAVRLSLENWPREGGPWVAVCLRALDALAREPGLEARVAIYERGCPGFGEYTEACQTECERRGCCEWLEDPRAKRIAALEAQLARVRDVRDDWKKRVGTASRGEVLLDSGYNEAWGHCLEAIDAALAVPTKEG